MFINPIFENFIMAGKLEVRRVVTINGSPDYYIVRSLAAHRVLEGCKTEVHYVWRGNPKEGGVFLGFTRYSLPSAISLHMDPAHIRRTANGEFLLRNATLLRRENLTGSSRFYGIIGANTCPVVMIAGGRSISRQGGRVRRLERDVLVLPPILRVDG